LHCDLVALGVRNLVVQPVCRASRLQCNESRTRRASRRCGACPRPGN
jgi:hypothetical protein